MSVSRRVLYMAHPLSPLQGEILAEPSDFPESMRVELALTGNLHRALRWLAWLRATFPRVTFMAPWIATVQSLHGDDSSAVREAGLVDDCAVVERCDGIVLCGGRISSGMQIELAHGTGHSWDRPDGFRVYDLVAIGREPPSISPADAPFLWAQRFGVYDALYDALDRLRSA